MSEPIFAGALLQIVPNLEHLTLFMLEKDSFGIRKMRPPFLQPLGQLFPGFDPDTAHLSTLTGLQDLKEIVWHGAEFHWVLDRLPRLEKLCLERPCELLLDKAPADISHSIKSLNIQLDSSALRRESSLRESLSSFLASLPSLETLQLPINDNLYDLRRKYAHPFVEGPGQGRYTHLLKALDPIATTLVNPKLSALDSLSSRYGNIQLRFLNYKFPGASFLRFTSLKRLCVTHPCLLGNRMKMSVKPSDVLLLSL